MKTFKSEAEKTKFLEDCLNNYDLIVETLRDNGLIGHIVTIKDDIPEGYFYKPGDQFEVRPCTEDDVYNAYMSDKPASCYYTIIAGKPHAGGLIDKNNCK